MAGETVRLFEVTTDAATGAVTSIVDEVPAQTYALAVTAETTLVLQTLVPFQESTDYMIVHESQNGKNVIKEVIIIPAVSDLANSGSGSAFLPSGNPAPDVTQTPETNDPNASTDTQPSGFNPQGVPETTGATPETITDEQEN